MDTEGMRLNEYQIVKLDRRKRQLLVNSTVM